MSEDLTWREALMLGMLNDVHSAMSRIQRRYDTVTSHGQNIASVQIEVEDLRGIIEAMDPATANPKMEKFSALYSAAPDMLEALEGMLALHIAHHNEPAHARARAAIAKAKGGDA